MNETQKDESEIGYYDEMICRSKEQDLIPSGWEPLSVDEIKKLGWKPTSEALHSCIFVRETLAMSEPSKTCFKVLDLTKLTPLVIDPTVTDNQISIMQYRGKEITVVLANRIPPEKPVA